MKVGCVTRHSYPSDQEIRITKFAATLREAGHEISVLCPGESRVDVDDDTPDARVVRLRPPLPGALGRFFCAPLPINPIWILWLWRQFSRQRLNVVIVRDLRLSLAALLAARMSGTKVILDLGEHYPGLMAIAGKQRLSHHLIRNVRLVRILEVIAVRMAEAVWVVVDENRDRLQKHNSQIEVINNYPMVRENPAAWPTVPLRIPTSEAPATLISLGIIDNIRGLDLAIDALAILVRRAVPVRLVIYGDGDFRPSLEEQVRRLGLMEHVDFRGWVPGDMRYEALKEGDLGLILHRICDLTHHTMPNKLFDYMSVGLPVIATGMHPVSRVIGAEDCGVVVDDNAEAVALAVEALLEDSELRARLGRNGKHALAERYRWREEGTKLLRSLDSVAEGRVPTLPPSA